MELYNLTESVGCSSYSFALPKGVFKNKCRRIGAVLPKREAMSEGMNGILS
jgi:hypothetical protein